MTELVEVELVVALVIALAVALPAGVVAASVIRAARLPHPAALIAALGVLTGVALVGFALTELAELATLAGTGLGALAGAVTSTYSRDDSSSD